MIRRFIITLFFLCALFCLGMWYLADGFSLGKMRVDFPNDPRFEVAAPSTFQIRTILAQPYHYIGKGSQCFVFESEDKQYVLKFFRLSRYRLPAFQQKLVLPPFLAKIQNERVEEKRIKREKLFASCKLAYEELRDETALVYLHLNKTNHLNQNVTLHDNFGRPHTIVIDDQAFMIQRKAQQLYPYLDSLIKEHKRDELRKALISLSSLLNQRQERGIADKDAEIHKNAGFRNGKALFLDVGQFYRAEEVEDREHIVRKLIAWLEEKDEALAKEASLLLAAPPTHAPYR